jgi:hypothetical protein
VALGQVVFATPAYADTTYLNGTLSQVDAESYVAVYELWTAVTSKQMNGFDNTQDIYSDTNLGKILQWNDDFRAFNVANGNCINTTFIPIVGSSLSDYTFIPAVGGYQYDQILDDCRSYISTTPGYNGILPVSILSNPKKSLMAAWAISSSAKSYADVADSSDVWRGVVALGVTPAYSMTIDGSVYHIGLSDASFNALAGLMAVGRYDWPGGTYYDIKQKTGHPLFYVAYKDGILETKNIGNPNSAVIYKSSDPWSAVGFSVNSDGSLSLPYSSSSYSWNVFQCVYSSTGDSIFSFTSQSASSTSYMAALYKVYQATYGEGNWKLIPYSSVSGFPDGGGGATPGESGSTVDVPSPTDGKTPDYFDDSKNYIDKGTGTTVTDTNTGLGGISDLLKWLGDMFNKLFGIIQDIPGTLWKFITDFFIGDLSGIDGSAFALDNLKNVFPFSTPNDLMKVFGILNSDPVAPVVTLSIPNFDGSYVSYVVDLNPLNDLAAVGRTGFVIVFVVGLGVFTVRIFGGS